MKPGILIIILIPFVAWGILRDTANTANGGSIDLRNRVTGARIAASGVDPYSYKWMKGEPEIFCDVLNERGSLLSKTTVTPFVLAAHAPLNPFNYRTSQWLWFLFQYFALAGGIFAWTRLPSKEIVKWGIGLSLLFCVSPSWRHHVDHGQIYVIYAMLILALVYLGQKKRSKPLSLIEGIGGAFVLGCRPTFLGTLASPMARRDKPILLGTLAGFLIVAVVPMLLFGSQVWTNYRTAMEVHTELYLHQLRVTPERASYPSTIEGIPLDTIAGFSRYIPFSDSSIYRILSFGLPAKFLLACWILAMAGSLFYMVRKSAPFNLLWWAICAWIVIGDFLIPAFRHTYNDVLALPMILIGLSALPKPGDRIYWIRACLGVLCFMVTIWWLPGSMRWFIPIPSFMLFVLSLVAAGWALSICRNQPKESI